LFTDPKDTKLPQRKRIWKVYEFIRDVNCDYGVEPIIFTPKEFKERQGKYFLRNILKEGEVLYESKR